MTLRGVGDDLYRHSETIDHDFDWILSLFTFLGTWRSVCESLSRLAKTSTRARSEITVVVVVTTVTFYSRRIMDKLIGESFTAVEAVWDYINRLQVIGYNVVGDVDPVNVKRNYM